MCCILARTLAAFLGEALRRREILLIPNLEGALNTGTLDRPTIFFWGAADFFC